MHSCNKHTCNVSDLASALTVLERIEFNIQLVLVFFQLLLSLVEERQLLQVSFAHPLQFRDL